MRTHKKKKQQFNKNCKENILLSLAPYTCACKGVAFACRWEEVKGKHCIPIYINKDKNPSIKSTRHVKANVSTQKENQNNQNSNNEVEDLMLKGHRLP
jgi:hypothetical protein